MRQIVSADAHTRLLTPARAHQSVRYCMQQSEGISEHVQLTIGVRVRWVDEEWQARCSRLESA